MIGCKTVDNANTRPHRYSSCLDVSVRVTVEEQLRANECGEQVEDGARGGREFRADPLLGALDRGQKAMDVDRSTLNIYMYIYTYVYIYIYIYIYTYAYIHI